MRTILHHPRFHALTVRRESYFCMCSKMFSLFCTFLKFCGVGNSFFLHCIVNCVAQSNAKLSRPIFKYCTKAILHSEFQRLEYYIENKQNYYDHKILILNIASLKELTKCSNLALYSTTDCSTFLR